MYRTLSLSLPRASLLIEELARQTIRFNQNLTILLQLPSSVSVLFSGQHRQVVNGRLSIY
jgi:hypothetical protein